MATLSTDLAQSHHRPWLSLRIAGLGPRLGATSTTTRYRLSSATIDGCRDSTITTAEVIPCLASLPDSISERINLQTGETELGGLSIGLRIAAAMPAGSGLVDLWDWLSVHQAADTWQLADDLTSSDTTMTLVSNAGLVEGQVVCLGSESILISAVDGGGADCTIVRGMYGTTAVEHLATPAGDGTLYSRPRYLRGRRVELRLNLCSSTSDSRIVYGTSEELVIWSGLIAEYELRDPHTLQLSCRSTLGRLDRTIGRDQWQGTVKGLDVLAGHQPDQVKGHPILVEIPDGATRLLPSTIPTEDAGGGWVRRFYARVGDCLAELECWTDSETATHGATYRIAALGLLDTDPTGLLQITDPTQTVSVWEVLLTSARPRGLSGYLDGSTPWSPFTVSGDSEASEHPADQIRILLESTGTLSNGPYDVLGYGWGGEVPADEIDDDAFQALALATSGLRFPNLVIGWEGKPERLRDLIVREYCGPLGWFLHQDLTGRISIGQLEDTYPGDVTATLSRVIPGSLSLRGQLPDTVSLQTWRYGYDWARGEYRRTRKVVGLAARDRLIEDDSELQIECKGIEPGEATGETTVGHRIAMLGRWWTSPPPLLACSVPLSLLQIYAPASLVALDEVDYPCPLTGGYSWDGIEAVVTARSWRLVLDGPSGIDLELLPLPAGQRGLWAPSATVVSVGDMDHREVTVEHDDYTEDADGDASLFTEGDYVALFDRYGAARCDIPVMVTSIGTDLLVLQAVFSMTGVEVVPAEGDVITFPAWDTGTAPEGEWTDPGMTDCVALADEDASPPQIGTSGDLPYEYGA